MKILCDCINNETSNDNNHVWEELKSIDVHERLTWLPSVADPDVKWYRCKGCPIIFCYEEFSESKLNCGNISLEMTYSEPGVDCMCNACMLSETNISLGDIYRVVTNNFTDEQIKTLTRLLRDYSDAE
jgi:hypothetical protein